MPTTPPKAGLTDHLRDPGPLTLTPCEAVD